MYIYFKFIKYIAIVVIVFINCGCFALEIKEMDYKYLKGEKVEKALFDFDVKFESLVFHDEPPGKLKKVHFEKLINDQDVIVYLWLEYNLSLFSMDRKWEPDNVKNAIIKDIQVSKKNNGVNP